MNKENKKESHILFFPILNEEELNIRTNKAQEGNVNAKLDIILHNQKVLNEKLSDLNNHA